MESKSVEYFSNSPMSSPKLLPNNFGDVNFHVFLEIYSFSPFPIRDSNARFPLFAR